MASPHAADPRKVMNSKRERAFRRALGKFYRLETPKGRQSFYRLVAAVGKFNVKSMKIIEKSPQIGPKSFQNQQKTTPYQLKCVLGAFPAPNRAQVGPRTPTVRRETRFFDFFCRKWRSKGRFLGPLEIPKSFQNRTFEYRRALWTPKKLKNDCFFSHS